MAIVLFNNPDSLQSVTLGTSETVIRRVLGAGMVNFVKQYVCVRFNRSVITWQAVWMVRESGWYHLCSYKIYIYTICVSLQRSILPNMVRVSLRYHLYLFFVRTCSVCDSPNLFIHRQLFYSKEAWTQIWDIQGSPFLFLHLLKEF